MFSELIVKLKLKFNSKSDFCQCEKVGKIQVFSASRIRDEDDRMVRDKTECPNLNRGSRTLPSSSSSASSTGTNADDEEHGRADDVFTCVLFIISAFHRNMHVKITLLQTSIYERSAGGYAENSILHPAPVPELNDRNFE